MPVISFDCLVSPSRVKELGELFDATMSRLAATGKASYHPIEAELAPTDAADIEAQLRTQPHPEDAVLVRYRIPVADFAGSLNELAMNLARYLTPQAELPKDPVLLMAEETYEIPATYPWAVHISR